MMDPVLDRAVRASLVLLFAATATHKLRDLLRFRATLADYAVLPPAMVALASVAVPLVEAVVAIACLVPAVRVAALGGVAMLLALYAGAIAANLRRGRDQLDCGCLGVAGRAHISWWLVARNAVVVAVALVATAPVQPRALVWLDHVTTFGVVAMTALAWLAVDGLLGNLPRVARVRSDA